MFVLEVVLEVVAGINSSQDAGVSYVSAEGSCHTFNGCDTGFDA
jgi:hypothetical protein